jgi:WD40 repeat protein
MELKTLPYIFHGKNKKKKLSIFSIDIEPFGAIIITSGQDSFIKLWINDFLFNRYLKKKIKKFKNLSSNEIFQKKNQSPYQILETNCGILNIIRWAPNGIFFASGTSEGLLLIYEKIKHPWKKKMWRILISFNLHKGEIIDLAWCPNSFFLISVSLDNQALIWDLKLKTLVIKFLGHSTWIKSVDWEISGRFLFTQTENKKIIVWKTQKWQFFKILKLKIKNKNFKKYGKINLFSRSIWSTCGNYLIFCNSSSKKKGVIFIFNRLKNFSNIIFLRGEKFCSSSLRSSLRIYKNSYSKEIFSLFSLGSVDGHLSIWKSNFSKPIISVKNLDKNQILDMSWSFNGYELFICLINGTIIGIKFHFNDLGKILNKTEHFEFIKINCLNLNKLKKIEHFFNFFQFILQKINIRKFIVQNFENFLNWVIKEKKFNIFFDKYLIFLQKLKSSKFTNKIRILIINQQKPKNFKNFFTWNYDLNRIFFSNFNLKVFFYFFFKIKKKIKFIVILKKKKSIFKFYFTFCPVFRIKNENLVFLNTKTLNLLTYEKILKPKNKLKINFPKIYSIEFYGSFFNLLDCNGNLFIFKFLNLTKIIEIKKISLSFIDFFKNKNYFDYFFTICSGLLNFYLEK